MHSQEQNCMKKPASISINITHIETQPQSDVDCLSSNMRQNKQQEESVMTNNSEDKLSPRKINHLHPGELKGRKLSMSNNAFFTKKNDNNVEQQSKLKSQKSPSEGGEKSFGVPETAWEYHPPEQDIESYFNKKMRALEAKYKKSTLQCETIALKLKDQRKELNSQLNFYKQFLTDKHPEINIQIQQQLKNRQQISSNSSECSSSESDGINEEISMPVKSQIIQVKIEGQKLCQKIRVYEHEIEELHEKIEKMAQKTEEYQVYRGCEGEKKNRQKKQSFQTNLISERSEKTVSDDFSLY